MDGAAPRTGSAVLRFFQPDREDLALRNIVTSVVLIVAAVWTIRPVGSSGTPLAIAVLIVVNCLLLLSRHIPDSRLSGPARTAVLYAGVAASTALIALGRSGVSSIFGFFVAGHAGYRLSSRPATAVAVACSVANGGVLLLGWGGGHWFTPWYVGAASGFSVLLGMLNRSREALYRSALDAAANADRAAQAEAREHILAERSRVARDVHDVLAHSLAGISMQLNLANALYDKGETARARTVTGEAQELVRQSLVEAQRTVTSLRDDALPVVETIQAMVRPHSAATMTVTGAERDVPAASGQALVRAAQESLTNAQKYAPAAPVTLTLDYGTDAVTLVVTNGRHIGAAPLAAAGSGLGLVGMRERVDAVGGSVAAGPTADGGWQVKVRIPT